MHPRYKPVPIGLKFLQTVIKSFEGWGQVIIFLSLELTLLVFSVSISSVIRVCNQGAFMAFCHGVYAQNAAACSKSQFLRATNRGKCLVS